MNKEQRKTWNDNHKKLTEIITKPEYHDQTVDLFLHQHAVLHNFSIESDNVSSLADALLNDLHETTFRKYPVTNPDTKNSIAWHIFHIARIEDMAMNILIADSEQILNSGNWLEKLNSKFSHSGNNMSEDEIAELSLTIDFDTLMAYREAVGRQTQQVVRSLIPGQFKLKVASNRIERLFEEQAITQDASWLAEYWSKKSIAGLILMPATRHNFLHLNKCIRIKEKVQKRSEIK